MSQVIIHLVQQIKSGHSYPLDFKRNTEERKLMKLTNIRQKYQLAWKPNINGEDVELEVRCNLSQLKRQVDM